MIAVLSAIAVAGGLFIGRLVAARHHAKSLPRAPDAGEEPLTPAPGSLSAPSEAPPSGEEAVDWTQFPCALGDVLIRTIDGAEAWLAGAVVLREDAPAAALFIAPDAAGDRAIYARPRPVTEIAWLTPLPREAVTLGAEPPSALEIDGTRFERNRRLPLRTQRLGTGTPDIEGTAILGEYRAASGDVAIVVIADGIGRAWRGRRLGEGEFEVWDGEKARGG
jgi:hypothetical protein